MARKSAGRTEKTDIRMQAWFKTEIAVKARSLGLSISDYVVTVLARAHRHKPEKCIIAKGIPGRPAKNLDSNE